jgi:hypothetical protein
MSFGANEYRFTAEQMRQNLIQMEKDKTEVMLGRFYLRFCRNSTNVHMYIKAFLVPFS